MTSMLDNRLLFTLACAVGKALSHLLLNQLDGSLSANVPLRRAAIDLLGRGFSVWQPYVDASAILLGLLEISYDADRILPRLVCFALLALWTNFSIYYKLFSVFIQYIKHVALYYYRFIVNQTCH